MPAMTLMKSLSTKLKLKIKLADKPGLPDEFGEADVSCLRERVCESQSGKEAD